MLYGICGSHRSGKTTLAQMLADELGIEFHRTQTTETARKYGFDPVGPMTLRERIGMQILLLGEHIEMLESTPRPLIVDRTPIDFLAYTMCEFHMQSHKLTDPDVMQSAVEFAEACKAATTLYYDHLYYLEPLSFYTPDKTKATPEPNPAFQQHFGYVMKGALFSLNGEPEFVAITEEDLEFRRDFVHDHIVERMDFIDQARKHASLH